MPKMANFFSIEDDLLFRALFTEMPCACMMHRMIFDESGNPIDYIPIEQNRRLRRTRGLRARTFAPRASFGLNIFFSVTWSLNKAACAAILLLNNAFEECRGV